MAQDEGAVCVLVTVERVCDGGRIAHRNRNRIGICQPMNELVGQKLVILGINLSKIVTHDSCTYSIIINVLLYL